MTREQWKDQFTIDLWGIMGASRRGTVMMPSSGNLVFGGYAIGFAAPREEDSAIALIATENVLGAAAVDGMQWSAKLEDDPHPTAMKVADWLRPRWRG